MLICLIGFYCDGTNRNSCSNGDYSTQGASSCTTCPLGFKCTSASALPVACEPGTKQSTNTARNSCVSCTGTENCEDPANPTTCANTELYGSGEYCDTCPAGYSCSGGSASRCNTNNLNKYSARGDNSCSTNSDRDKIVPTPEYGVVLDCPTGTFRTSASSGSYCEVCPAGKACSGNQASYTSCTSTQ